MTDDAAASPSAASPPTPPAGRVRPPWRRPPPAMLASPDDVLKSVRTAVQQHGGSMTLHWENNWCTLRILFPLPKNK